MSDFPPIALVVPHQEPMVLLDRIVDWAPGRIECTLLVQDEARFVEEGVLAAPFTIEHMAQAVAACMGYEAYLRGLGVRAGMIVACREFEALRPSAAVGEALQVRADRDRGNDSLSHFRCAIHDRNEAFATATLTLFHGETLVGPSL